MGEEVNSKPTDSNPLQEFKLPQPIAQPIFNFQDLSTMDYNTYDTDNLHQESKVSEAIIEVIESNTSPTSHYNIPDTKYLPQESQPSDQPFGYLIQIPPSTIGSSLSYDICQANYPSRNKLFNHIREAKYYRKGVVV